MWDRYSDGHKGVLLGFDGEHEFFRPHPEQESNPQNLRPIVYKPSREPMNLVDLNEVELFFLKTSDWSSEQELRMVRLLTDATKTDSVDADGHPVYVIDVPAECFGSVVFGERAQSSLKSEVDALLSCEALAHVKRYALTTDYSSAQLKMVAL